MKLRRLIFVAFLPVTVLLLGHQTAFAQATTGTGSITGIVTDPQDAAVPHAKVTITNRDTGLTLELTTNSSGVYNSGNLVPGNYLLKVSAPNFKTTRVTAIVQIGQIAPGNIKLQLGSSTTVIEVRAEAAHVNEEQATVQDVLTAQDIDELPVNGRNFLDLASLEPGVQIQDGSTLDPTKGGYSSISFGGRTGRTARVEVDGLDISDETEGSITQNISQSAIQEFQVASSSLDLSTELTSSGTINVVTKSGTNSFHGGAFYYGRSDQISARIAPTDLPFGREQFGGDLGGPIIKNRLFFFADVERTDQTLANPVTLSGDFAALSGSYGSPFTEREYSGRMDVNIRAGWTLFYKFSYDQNRGVRSINPGVYQPFANVNYTPAHAIGTDYTAGKFTHSIRLGYLKYRNSIVDATAGVFNPAPSISLVISPVVGDLACVGAAEEFCSGTNFLAPQKTFQSNKQVKYDGSYTFGNHVIRYGGGYNRILGGGFAAFLSTAPFVSSTFDTADETFAAASPFAPGGAGNPLNWPVSTVIMGNGQGFFTERPQFGLPAGGNFDSRVDWYLGDSWKARHNLTITYGIHYGRDTGRTDSDLPVIPVLAQFDNQFFQHLERRVNQPNKNFGPQVGFAWDPWGSGKTVIRAGAGIYYENVIFAFTSGDRPARLPTGLFFTVEPACFFGEPTPVPLPGGGSLNAGFCGQPIGAVVSDIVGLQRQYQAAVLAAGPQANGDFVGKYLSGGGLFAPDYRSPRSYQMNAGVQHQFGHGTVLTADYVRNVGLRYLVGQDTNKVGDARFLNFANAQNAIAATNAALGCGASFSGASIDCAISKQATIGTYAQNGLDSGDFFAGGLPCPVCAFPGVNPNVGSLGVLFPIGRSLYNGLLVELKSNLNHPLPGVKRMMVISSYALSRFKSLGFDQDNGTGAIDDNNPLRFIGPNGLDRTHQVSVGSVIDLPWTTRIALATHWYTALPNTLSLPSGGDIFTTDVDGDGNAGDVVPGSNVGSFGRSIKLKDLNKFIANYNNTSAGKLTPAGQALVSAGLFTQAQLTAIGAVTPPIQPAPNGEVGISPLFTFDIHAAWELKLNRLIHALPEPVILEPQIAIFNLFNFHNYDPVGNVLGGVLDGGPGDANGTTAHDQPGCSNGATILDSSKCTGRRNLITPGTASGVNWYAVPRQAEIGVKLTF
jgi:hypothetical protein